MLEVLARNWLTARAGRRARPLANVMASRALYQRRHPAAAIAWCDATCCPTSRCRSISVSAAARYRAPGATPIEPRSCARAGPTTWAAGRALAGAMSLPKHRATANCASTRRREACRAAHPDRKHDAQHRPLHLPARPRGPRPRERELLSSAPRRCQGAGAARRFASGSAALRLVSLRAAGARSSSRAAQVGGARPEPGTHRSAARRRRHLAGGRNPRRYSWRRPGCETPWHDLSFDLTATCRASQHRFDPIGTTRPICRRPARLPPYYARRSRHSPH